MMMMFCRSIAALAILSGAVLASLAGPAAAEEFELFPEGTFDADPRAAPNNDDAAEAEEQALRSATYCDQYGPDYTLVPGTTTCIKVGGHVQVDVYMRSGRGR
jgi:hypothetical protein